MTKKMQKLLAAKAQLNTAAKMINDEFSEITEEKYDFILEECGKTQEDFLKEISKKRDRLRKEIAALEVEEERNRLCRKYDRQKGESYYVVLEIIKRKPIEEYSSAVEVTTRVALLTKDEDAIYNFQNHEDNDYTYTYSIQPVKVGHGGLWSHSAHYGHTE